MRRAEAGRRAGRERDWRCSRWGWSSRTKSSGSAAVAARVGERRSWCSAEEGSNFAAAAAAAEGEEGGGIL